MNPTVSFVVPCYKLAHLLSECVESILAQTYSDFEVLIMDDCSPDNTPEVAQSFQDPRVRHIRNEPNLGHLRNYNKGIELSRGKYVWLISADDVLRRNYLLQRYVSLMEKYSSVGFCCCAGIGLRGKEETGILPHYYHGNSDRIYRAGSFLPRLIHLGGVLSPSVLARKKCYQELGLFPLDRPHQGDVFLWSMWALRYDVAYFSEPMVNYRLHEQSMMSSFKRDASNVMVADELAVLWHAKREAMKLGYSRLAGHCDYFIACKYAQYIVSGLYEDRAVCYSMSVEQCEDSVRQFSENLRERTSVLARLYIRLGDEHYWHGDFDRALQFYRRGLEQDTHAPKAWLKYALLYLGGWGARSRNLLFTIRRIVGARS